MQSFRSHWRDRRLPAVCIALCLAFFSAPILSAQNAASWLSDDTQLQLAQQQGNAETVALDWVLANSGELKGDTRVGGMRVAFTITPAEGWWDKAGGGKLAWHEAPDDNVHLRIFVLDLADGRLIPGLKLCATLIDANGNEQSAPADFGWYPLINAYGGNVPIAADSTYTLRVNIDGPLPRPNDSFGERIQHPAVAEFSPVPIALDEISQLPLATTTDAAQEAELLKPRNDALADAITALWQQSVSGAEKADGDYYVAYALGLPGVAIPLGGAKLHLKNLVSTGKDEVSLELLARDSRTGRIIPGLKPQANFVGANGDSYGPGKLSLSPYSWITRYKGNARIPGKGLYTLHVHFDAPGFRRWGRQSERFAVPADVDFENISLKPGKKD